MCVWGGVGVGFGAEREIKSFCLQAGVSASPDSLISWSTGCASRTHSLLVLDMIGPVGHPGRLQKNDDFKETIVMEQVAPELL